MLESPKRGCTLEGALAVVPFDKPALGPGTRTKKFPSFASAGRASSAPQRTTASSGPAPKGRPKTRVCPLKHAISARGEMPHPRSPQGLCSLSLIQSGAVQSRGPKGACLLASSHCMRGSLGGRLRRGLPTYQSRWSACGMGASG